MSKKIIANNPANRTKWIDDLFTENPEMNYTLCWGLYSEKWGRRSSTFDKEWGNAKKNHQKRAELIQQIKNEEVIKMAKDGVKTLIKNKEDRIQVLQTQIDKCIKELDENLTSEMKWEGNSKVWINVDRPLSVNERVSLRKTIKELQEQISKIEGDFAPITNINQNTELPPPAIVFKKANE